MGPASEDGDRDGPISAAEVSEEVLSCFWGLASLEDDARQQAAASLIALLVKSQDVHDSSGAKTAADGGHLDASLSHCSPTVRYSVKRLVKGLSSSRKGARQGFALALTGVLQHVPCWEPEQLTAFIASLSDISVGGSREDILGHLFALGAVVRSGIDLDVPMAASVAEQAIGLAHKKSFLREAAVELVIELCTNRSELSVAELVDSSPQLSAFLAAPCDKASPEALALAVRLSGRMSAEQRNACTHLPPGSPGFSAAVFNATNKKARSKSDAAAAAAFFTEQHMRQLVPVLRSSTQAHPRLNVVWPTLLVALVPGYATSTEGAAMVPVGQLQAFWSILVEEDIFKSASHERKFLAFSLFEELSRCLKAECALPMLTPNFLRSVANNATKQGTYLHTAAQHCMESIGALAACSDAGARAEVFVALNRNGGNAYARLLNKSRGAQDSDHDAEKLVDKLVKEFDELKGDEALSRRKWILSQLAATIKQKQNGPAVAKQVIDFLIEKGLFGGVNSAEEGGDGLRVQCASQFITTLDWLVRPRTQDRKDTADPDILGQTMTHIEERVAAGAELATPPTDASEKAGEVLSTLRTSLQEQLSATANESSEAHRQLDALRQLVCFLELHALINPDNADADLASDLARVFDDKFGQAASKQAGDDGVHWADALVDILLSILAANQVPFPSAPLRDAAERVFRAFAADVSATGIQDLLAVVERPLDQKEGEDEDDGDEDGSEEDDGEDNDAAEDDSDSHAGSDDEASDEGSDASSDEDISDAEAGDDPMEATDEQMFKMDAMLAATFATMRSSRDNKRARQDAINFKLRSLACLEAYVKKVPEGPLLLRMPAPLLTALTGANKSGGDRVLAERIAAVIKARLSKCKAHAEGDEDAEEMKAQLRRALFLASRAEDKLVEDAATAAYCFLQRSLYDSDLKDVQASAQESAATALADFFDKKKTRLGRPFFQQLFTRAPSVAAGALPTLLTFCASARNEFKQQEAYWMVGVAVKAADSRVAQALKEANAAMAAMVETALGGAIAKPARRAEAVKTVCSVAQTLSSKGSSLLEVLGAKLGKKVSAAVKKAEAEHENDPHIARLAAILAGKETKAAGKRKGRPEAQAKKPSKKK